MDPTLEQLLHDFEAWAQTAPRDFDGWESNFPDWSTLIHQARDRFATGEVTHASELARVLSISEETEDLADTLSQPTASQELLWAIIKVGDSHARWQTYAFGGWSAAHRSEALARGCRDEHPYVALRALLALAETDPPMAKQAARQLVKAADTRLSKVAKAILNAG